MDKRTNICPDSSLKTHFVHIHEFLPGDEDEGEEGRTRLKKGLNRESKARDDRRILQRSGRSFGGFDAGDRIGRDARRSDFNIFRTKSTLYKQNSLLPTRKERSEMESKRTDDSNGFDDSVNRSVPAGRYFAALRGPELDIVKDYEDILLPKDEKWPFLLRFPIGCFGICLGLSSQAVLWRTLSTSPAIQFLHVTPFINLLLWLLALAVLLSVSFTYILKCIYYFEAVRKRILPSRQSQLLLCSVGCVHVPSNGCTTNDRTQ
ncbi:hypothetical protein SLA2020_145510 [Shorea laevis]